MNDIVPPLPAIGPDVLHGIQGLNIDPVAARNHVIRPPNVVGIVSSRGLEEGAITAHPVTHPGPPPGPPLGPKQLDVNAFGQSLHAAMKDSVAGYAMQLRQHGTPIYTLEWNWAKYPNDGGAGWNMDRRMHIASCSKMITAMAMTRTLNLKNMSYDAKILGWLPAYWAKGPNIDKITFRDLMTHRSGFNTGKSDSDFNFMRDNVASGVTVHGTYHYQNMNFGLCRILIATINGNIAPSKIFPFPGFPGNTFNDLLWDFTTIAAYKQYMAQHVFAPAGVSGPSSDHPDPDALAYKFPVNGGGWNSGDLTAMLGGAGWHMSVDDLLAVMGQFRRGNGIMTKAQAQTMLDNGFGIDVIASTPLGTLYNKNGGWGAGSGESEQSLSYFLPQDMELVVLTNSNVASPAVFFRDYITNIYLKSIKPA